MSPSTRFARALNSFLNLGGLTPTRARTCSVVALVTMAALIAGVVLLAHHNPGATRWMGWDFACFWTASHLALTGNAAGAYVPASFYPFEAAVLPPHVYLPFFYPPSFLLLISPLALLPYAWSLAFFLTFSAAVFAAAIFVATRSRWLVFAALASPAMLRNLFSAQNAMLTAAILGAGLALMDRRPRLAGLILGLMVIKPQLALAVPFALLFSRRWNVLAYAALSGTLLMLLSALILGTGAWTGFLGSAPVARDLLEHPANGWDFLSAFFWARQQGVSIPLAYALQALIAALGLALLFWAQTRKVAPTIERALIILISLVITPYVLPYDLVVIAFPLAWLLMEWSETGFPPGGKPILLLAYILPLAPVAAHIVKALPAHLWLCGTLGLIAYVAWTETRALPRPVKRPLPR